MAKKSYKSKLLYICTLLFLITTIVFIPLSALSIQAHAEGTVSFTEFDIPNSQPRGIALGPDGNLWFTQDNRDAIGRMTPAGVVTEFEFSNDCGINPGSCIINAITSGADGNLWYTETKGDKIGRITPDGEITRFPLYYGANPWRITAGPDGNLWFTLGLYSNSIGRMTPAGIFTEFPLPTNCRPDEGVPQCLPMDITTGPDGNLWFTERAGHKIGRITPNGVITEFALDASNPEPLFITAGPDGNLWFSAYDGSWSINRITLEGVVTQFPNANEVTILTSGKDGNVWFTEFTTGITQFNTGAIGRITTAGTIAEYPLPSPGLTAAEIITDSSDNLWVTDPGGNNIWRVTVTDVIPVPTSTFTPTFTAIPTQTSTTTPTITPTATVTQTQNRFVLSAPFTLKNAVYYHDPREATNELAALKGFSGVLDVQQELESGNIGYKSFAWGGMEGFYNWTKPKKNPPSEKAYVRTLMGEMFTAPVTGTYKIRAEIAMEGHGFASASESGLAFLLEFIPGEFGDILGWVDLSGLLPSAARAQNSVILKIDRKESRSEEGFGDVAADSVLLDEYETQFSGLATIETTISLKKGQTVSISAGLQSDVSAWGNGAVMVDSRNSRLVQIVIEKQQR